LTDGIGFGLEHYDAVGEYRDKQIFKAAATRRQGAGKGGDRGAKPAEIAVDLDTTGKVAGLPAPEFTTIKQLGTMLAQAEKCQECIVKQVFRYMSGRQDTSADIPVIDRALETFRSSGFHYREMVVSLIKQWDFPISERSEHVASNHQAH
jgi:hypothetical protein